jgi:general secretion pathway protein A
MSYFKALGLEREPFSTSPDPSFFFLSEEHKAALRRLQIAVSLRRGLSVILGDVGTGKTTLSRKLSRELRDNENVLFHMILNPYFKTEKQFLNRLASLFHIDIKGRASGLDVIELIEKYLFKRGVEEQKTIVLLIDEAQILPNFVLEILRILLNYETNEYKILQLVLMGQLELLPRISQMSNFWDRIALRYVLNPLGEQEVREMVDFRLSQAGYKGEEPLFTDEAIKRIWEHTGGYPRKLTLMCHNALEGLVMYERERVDEEVVARLIADDVQPVVAPEPVMDYCLPTHAEEPEAPMQRMSLRDRFKRDARGRLIDRMKSRASQPELETAGKKR